MGKKHIIVYALYKPEPELCPPTRSRAEET